MVTTNDNKPNVFFNISNYSPFIKFISIYEVGIMKPILYKREHKKNTVCCNKLVLFDVSF